MACRVALECIGYRQTMPSCTQLPFATQEHVNVFQGRSACASRTSGSAQCDQTDRLFTSAAAVKGRDAEFWNRQSPQAFNKPFHESSDGTRCLSWSRRSVRGQRFWDDGRTSRCPPEPGAPWIPDEAAFRISVCFRP